MSKNISPEMEMVKAKRREASRAKWRGRFAKWSWNFVLAEAFLLALHPPAATAALLIATVLTVLHFRTDEDFKFRQLPFDVPVALFVFLSGVSIMVSPDKGFSFYNWYNLVGVYVLTYFVVGQNVRSVRQVKELLLVIGMAAVFVLLYGFYQFIFGIEISAMKWVDGDAFPELRKRVFSTWENPNILAGYLDIIICLAFGLFIKAGTKQKRIVLGVLLAMQGRFTLGMILLFQGFLSSFMAPAGAIISAGQRLQEMRTEMERVEDVMNYPEDPVLAAARNSDADSLPEDAGLSKLSGEIELRHVSFGYSRLEEPLIRDFSLHVAPGSRVALVGPSGCGKSTIAKLIAGICTPRSGEVLFDGKPITEIDRNVFTGSVAVVDQDIVLFGDTIAENIRMWDDSITDFEVILAARDARIYDDIMAREGGFQARLAENGRDLSGGQRQRLEIARALAQDPSIIILDEATSALDARTEHELVKAVNDRGITCIVVAHRLSTIRDCDEIIVLDHGLVTERGTHEELMAKGGAYAQLIASD